jgi:hypothetical protein
MYASISFQNVSKVTAHAFLDLDSTPFFVAFESTENDEGGKQYSRGEVCLHLKDRALASALAEAINRVVAEHEAATKKPFRLARASSLARRP